METDILYTEICNIVREAGDIIHSLSSVTELKAKEGSANFVTKYDSIVQEFLIQKLSILVPDAAFVGEEDGYSEQKISEGRTFIIDPIDGTTNFICGFMASGICVGLADHGVIEIGVVYNPFRDEFFSAKRGSGAFLNGVSLHPADHTLKESVLCADTAPYNPEIRENIFEELRQLSYLCMDMRSIGSAALSICYVACGRSAAYVSPRLCVWDYAAASLILTEAGGILTDRFGRDLRLSTHISVVAATPRAHAEIMESCILK